MGATLDSMVENKTLHRFLNPDAKAFCLSILHTRRGAPTENAEDDAEEVKEASLEVRAQGGEDLTNRLTPRAGSHFPAPEHCGRDQQ